MSRNFEDDSIESSNHDRIILQFVVTDQRSQRMKGWTGIYCARNPWISGFRVVWAERIRIWADHELLLLKDLELMDNYFLKELHQQTSSAAILSWCSFVFPQRMLFFQSLLWHQLDCNSSRENLKGRKAIMNWVNAFKSKIQEVSQFHRNIIITCFGLVYMMLNAHYSQHSDFLYKKKNLMMARAT